jgi:hypothetical protein
MLQASLFPKVIIRLWITISFQLCFHFVTFVLQKELRIYLAISSNGALVLYIYPICVSKKRKRIEIFNIFCIIVVLSIFEQRRWPV